MIATFINASNQAPIELLIRGSWLERSATITMGEQVVAQISRSYFNAREMIGGQQSVSHPDLVRGGRGKEIRGNGVPGVEMKANDWITVLRYHRTWCGPCAYGRYLCLC